MSRYYKVKRVYILDKLRIKRTQRLLLARQSRKRNVENLNVMSEKSWPQRSITEASFFQTFFLSSLFRPTRFCWCLNWVHNLGSSWKRKTNIWPINLGTVAAKSRVL
jgi:hypothetical protein